MLHVIVSPAAIVTPLEVPGDHAMNDATVEAMIAAVQAEIDGPLGWVGRSFGLQTLELRMECWPRTRLCLPCPPVVNVLSVKYVDRDDVEQTVDPALYGVSAGYLWFRTGFAPPSLGERPYPVIISYRAGHDKTSISAGGTGDPPANAKRAVILSVQNMMSISRDDLFLKAEEVEGVGRQEWVVSDRAGALLTAEARNLLQGLMVLHV